MCNVCDLRTTCLLTLGQFAPFEDRTLIAECIAIEFSYDRDVEIRLFGYTDAHHTEIMEKANDFLRRPYSPGTHLDPEEKSDNVK